MTTTTTTNSQRGRHFGAQQRRRESTKETEGWARREGLGGPTERETRRERRTRERKGPGGERREGGDCVARANVEESRQTRRQTRSGRRSTRAAALEENVVKRNGDGTTKGTEL